MGHALVALLAFIIPFILSLGLTALARRVSPRMGFTDDPGGRKAHERPMPLGGGVALFLAWAVPIGVMLLVALGLSRGEAAPEGQVYAPSFRAHLDELADRANPLSLVLVGGLLIMVLGLLDDLLDLSASAKLVVQIGVASGLWLASHELRVTLFMGWTFPSFLYTVLWIVGITNAFNFLDNTDGLSAGVALVASVILSVVGFQTGQEVMAWLALGLAGAAAGFLVFNFPPATIYMGDAGGLFLGFALAVLTILFTFYRSGPTPSGHLYGVLMPLFILALPIFDTLMVVTIRLRERRPIWRGDRCHFSHRLLALGMSKRETVLFIYLVTFCLGLASTLLNSLDHAGAIIILVIGVAIFVLIALLERAGRRRTQ
jgi:UDP-GlcNAc:undecaprenyl-phosphate GlcNAc-1-phosphate transferase